MHVDGVSSCVTSSKIVVFCDLIFSVSEICKGRYQFKNVLISEIIFLLTENIAPLDMLFSFRVS